MFEPNSIAEYVESMTIHSNDPANPEKVIELMSGIFDGAYVRSSGKRDFGIVRMNSTSRKYLHVKNKVTLTWFCSMNFSSDYFSWTNRWHYL